MKPGNPPTTVLLTVKEPHSIVNLLKRVSAQSADVGQPRVKGQGRSIWFITDGQKSLELVANVDTGEVRVELIVPMTIDSSDEIDGPFDLLGALDFEKSGHSAQSASNNWVARVLREGSQIEMGALLQMHDSMDSAGIPYGYTIVYTDEPSSLVAPSSLAAPDVLVALIPDFTPHLAVLLRKDKTGPSLQAQAYYLPTPGYKRGTKE